MKNNDSKAVKFALQMKRIPRKVAHCEIYGTAYAIVDKRHATNIIKMYVPTASHLDVQEALLVLQDRLDETRE